MKILIITVGSRGDVQPFVALGKGLLDYQHEVMVCTCSRFESFILDHGVEYGFMHDEIIQLIDSKQGRELMEDTNGIFRIALANIKLAKQVAPMQRLMIADCWNAAQKFKPDVVLFHPKGFGAHPVAEKMGIPAILALPFPMLVKTVETPCPGFPVWPFKSFRQFYNRLTYRLVRGIMNLAIGRYIKEWRRRHGLASSGKRNNVFKKFDGSPVPVLHCYSVQIVPEPTDWPANAITSGYWFLEERGEFKPPDRLLNFLENGEMPVYIGFGSMAGRHPERLAGVVVQALQQAGIRGIIGTGWGGLQPNSLPENVLAIDSVPHDWLFPRVAAVVHHGGAGTTAAGILAGCPSIICHFFGDQPFWGHRVYSLGVGPKPIPQKELTVDKLAAALRLVVGDKGMRERARILGQDLRDEDGVAKAVRFIEKVCQHESSW